MRQFTFKEIDEEGLQTLETIADAHRFNRWMYETIAQYTIPGNILEIGSGIGNISHFFLEDGRDIYQSDIRGLYCSYLARTYGQHPHCKDILQLDLVHPDFTKVYASILGTFDNLYALNVVEHIEDDQQAIANCYKLLKAGGRLIILVPAFQSLYNSFDKELFHYRRYSRQKLEQLLISHQFKLQKSFYFNFMGILGWFVSGKLMKNRVIPDGQMQLYNRLVPVFKLLDLVLNKVLGLSVVAIGDRGN